MKYVILVCSGEGKQAEDIEVVTEDLEQAIQLFKFGTSCSRNGCSVSLSCDVESEQAKQVEEEEQFYFLKGGLENHIVSDRRCTCYDFVHRKLSFCPHIYDIREVPVPTAIPATKADYHKLMNKRYTWLTIGPDGRRS